MSLKKGNQNARSRLFLAAWELVSLPFVLISHGNFADLLGMEHKRTILFVCTPGLRGLPVAFSLTGQCYNSVRGDQIALAKDNR